MPEDITRNGVAAGKHDVEYEGAQRVIYDSWTLGTYDNADDGNGNTFDVRTVYGMSRVQKVNLSTPSGYVVKYDYTNNAVRVYQQANDGTGTAGDALTEVSQGTALNIDIRAEVRGRGN